MFKQAQNKNFSNKFIFMLRFFTSLGIFLGLMSLKLSAQVRKILPVKPKNPDYVFSIEHYYQCLAYLDWKKRVAKKLSPNQRIILDGAKDMDLVELEPALRAIVFYKDNQAYLRVLPQGWFPLYKQQTERYVGECRNDFLSLLERAHYRRELSSYEYRYTDGNNNTWHWGYGFLTYRGVRAEHSSSGVYEGGEDFSLELDGETYEVLAGAARAAFEVEGLAHREMGCGTIGRSLKDYHQQRLYLPMDSPEKRVLEQRLRALKP